MIKLLCAAASGLFLLALPTHAASPGPERVVKQDRARILHQADAALTMKPVSITTDRSPLSDGRPDEFFSMSDYYWPDPSKPDGKPYLMRDGQSNPGNFNEHRKALMAMRDATSALAAAYLLTDDERYAAKATSLLKAFFIDKETRMHPSLDHAQAIVGKATPQRGTGLIDTLHLIEVPLAILALRDSKAMSEEDFNSLRQWFVDYTKWFIESPKGKNESNAKNNHAVAYWLQVAAFATLTADAGLLDECRRQFKEVFVPIQMGADGGFPLELARTKPYAYSIFQLDLMTALCQLLSTPSDNLWTFTAPDGKNMAKAVAFLHPYLADKASWPKAPDVNAWEGWPVRQPSLLFGGLALQEEKYVMLWQTLKPDPQDFEIRRNNPLTQPLLWTSLFAQSSSPTATRRLRASDVYKPKQRILFEDNFQDRALPLWNFSEDGRYSLAAPTPRCIQVVDAPKMSTGTKAVRFTVERAPNSFRSEISLPSERDYNERWYAGRIFIPEDWVFDPGKGQDIVMQWHGVPGNWRPTFPNLAISVSKDRWRIAQSYGSPQAGPTRNGHVLDEPVKRGQWVAWIIHAKWSPDDKGLLQIWRDGKLVFERKGPNVYGTIGVAYTPYLKTGIYHPEWRVDQEQKRLAFEAEKTEVKRRVVYVADVKVGTEQARLEDFLPAPQPVAP